MAINVGTGAEVHARFATVVIGASSSLACDVLVVLLPCIALVTEMAGDRACRAEPSVEAMHPWMKVLRHKQPASRLQSAKALSSSPQTPSKSNRGLVAGLCGEAMSLGPGPSP